MHASFSLPTGSRYCGADSLSVSHVSVPLIVRLVVTSIWRLCGPSLCGRSAEPPPSEPPAAAVHTSTVSCCAHSKFCTLRLLLDHSLVRSRNNESVDTHTHTANSALFDSALRTRTDAAASAVPLAASSAPHGSHTHSFVHVRVCRIQSYHVRSFLRLDTASSSSSSVPPPRQMKYVAVTGGVVSGLGKGITSSSIGVLLKQAGLSVTSIKIDPYLVSCKHESDQHTRRGCSARRSFNCVQAAVA